MRIKITLAFHKPTPHIEHKEFLISLFKGNASFLNEYIKLIFNFNF